VLLVAAVNRVTLVDDLGPDRPPVLRSDTDLLVAAVCAVEPQPPGGQYDQPFFVQVGALVAGQDVILISAPPSPLSNMVKTMIAGVLADTGGEQLNCG
jgi:hypothetical protein